MVCGCKILAAAAVFRYKHYPTYGSKCSVVCVCAQPNILFQTLSSMCLSTTQHMVPIVQLHVFEHYPSYGSECSVVCVWALPNIWFQMLSCMCLSTTQHMVPNAQLYVFEHRDRNEYWKCYSNIWYNSSNIFKYSFWKIMPLSGSEIVSLSRHRTYQDTGTSHDQSEVQKVRSGVSINYLELGSWYMLHCFLTTWNARRSPAICKFKIRSVCVTYETRCQHESIDGIVKTESNSNRMICGEA